MILAAAGEMGEASELTLRCDADSAGSALRGGGSVTGDAYE